MGVLGLRLSESSGLLCYFIYIYIKAMEHEPSWESWAFASVKVLAYFAISYIYIYIKAMEHEPSWESWAFASVKVLAYFAISYIYIYINLSMMIWRHGWPLPWLRGLYFVGFNCMYF